MPIDAVDTSVKLRPRFYGPYVIVAYVGPQTVKLKLPPGSNVHPDFHTSKLKKFYGNADEGEEVQEIPEPDLKERIVRSCA